MSKKSFKEAYGVLQRHSEALRNQREPNIDDLLTIVTESVEAYKVCTGRIDAVEQALEQALGGAGIATSAADGPELAVPQPQAMKSKRDGDTDEDDLPF